MRSQHHARCLQRAVGRLALLGGEPRANRVELPCTPTAAMEASVACRRHAQHRISIGGLNHPCRRCQRRRLPAGAALLLLAGPVAAADSCIQQLGRIPGATTKWVDPDTPATACGVQLCTDNSYEACSPTDPAATIPRTNMQVSGWEGGAWPQHSGACLVHERGIRCCAEAVLQQLVALA